MRADTVAGAINVVAIDPIHPEIVYVGTASGGVWKTLDSNPTIDVPIDLYAADPLRETAPDTGANSSKATLMAGAGLRASVVYYYKVAFVNDTLATDSNASETIVWDPVTATNGQIKLENLPIGPAGTTGPKIYRASSQDFKLNLACSPR